MLKCEYCNEEHEGLYGSGRFCNQKCARGFSSKEKREEINLKVSQKLRKYNNGLSVEKLIDVIQNSHTMAEAARTLSMPFTSMRRLAETYRIYKPNQGWSKNFILPSKRKTKEYFIENILTIKTESKRNKWSNKDIKLKLFEFQLKSNICEECGQTAEWNGKKLVMHLDHVNGNNQDSKLDNLKILCPNCHSQTSTYCRGQGKNKNKAL